MSYTNPINVILWYIIIVINLTSFMQIIHGDAINLTNNKPKIPALLVFGDSILDTGNNNYVDTIAKANFLPYGRDFKGGPSGRFSNGKIPSDLIAERLGIKELLPPYLDPTLKINDLLTGVSFAFGGSGYDPETAKSQNVKSMDEQLNLFKEYKKKLKAAIGENASSTVISESVYIVCAGSNDIIITYFTLPFRRLQYSVSSYTSLMLNWASAFVQELYALGARKIAVTSAPPASCVPLERTFYGGLTRSCSSDINRASILYNTKLSSELNSLKRKLKGSTLVYLDIYSPIHNLVTNPSQSGFQVANKGCCGTGKLETTFLCSELSIGTCKNASKYVFWDSVHPTEAAYRLLVQENVLPKLDVFA